MRSILLWVCLCLFSPGVAKAQNFRTPVDSNLSKIPIKKKSEWQQITIKGGDDGLLGFLPKTTGHRKILGHYDNADRSKILYWVFYKNDGSATDASVNQTPWSSSVVLQPFGVRSFLNNLHKNGVKASDLEITAIQGTKDQEFHVFYRTTPLATAEADSPWTWDYRAFGSPQEVSNFLNGSDSSSPGVSSVVRVTSFLEGSTPQYFVFFQKRPNALVTPNQWYGLKYASDPVQLNQGLNGSTKIWGSNIPPALDFEILPVPGGIVTLRNRNTKVHWGHVAGERIVVGPDLKLDAIVFHWRPITESSIQWYSNVSKSFVGKGNNPLVAGLGVGSQTISPTGLKADFSNQGLYVRAFANMQVLALTEPSQAEYERILEEFEVHFEDGSGQNETWTKKPYYADVFDKASNLPSKKVALNNIDLLRHVRFSKPYPKEMLVEPTIFRQIKRTTKKLFFHLNCDINWAGAGEIHFSRGYSQWSSGNFGSGPNSCKETSPTTPPNTDFNFVSIGARYLFVHEGRHNENLAPIFDPGHTTCKGSEPYTMDEYFQGGSGYAAAANFLTWTSQFSTVDTFEAREIATQSAKSILNSRFCSGVFHSDPVVQSALQAVLAGKTPQ